jgi:hypothetical protein
VRDNDQSQACLSLMAVWCLACERRMKIDYIASGQRKEVRYVLFSFCSEPSRLPLPRDLQAVLELPPDIGSRVGKCFEKTNTSDKQILSESG